MRLTYVIRSVNYWFHRVVYERDDWDESLEQAARGAGHWALVAVLQGARFFVWLSRRLLWVLMLIGHGISCFMLRQMEFDADRHTARLVGGTGFESMCRELSHLGVAYQKTLFSLGQSWREGRLVDSVPDLVYYNQQRLSAELRDQVRQALDEQKTGLFDTHPADKDRIANARREGDGAVFRSELPARALFRDFKVLAHEVSLAFYGSQLDAAIRPEDLRSADQMVAAEERRAREEQAAARLFQGALNARRPLRFTAAVDTFDPAGLRSELGELRSRLERDGDGYRAAIRRYVEAAAQQVAETTAQRELDAELAPFETAAARRLQVGLAALTVADLVERDDEIIALERERSRLETASRALAAAFGRLAHLRAGAERVAALGAMLQKESANEELANRFVKEGEQLHPMLADLAARWAGIPYPLDHAGADATLGGYAVPGQPDVNDVVSMFNLAQETLGRSYELYLRSQARLALLGERVEERLGFEPLPAPEPAAES